MFSELKEEGSKIETKSNKQWESWKMFFEPKEGGSKNVLWIHFHFSNKKTWQVMAAVRQIPVGEEGRAEAAVAASLCLQKWGEER